MNDNVNDIKSQISGIIDLNFDKVKYQYCNEYHFAEFDPLRDEICKCIMLDLNQAAITLTNHLLESFLKMTIIYNDSIDNNKDSGLEMEEYFKDSMNHYDSSFLEQTINAACSKGLISKEQKKVFQGFKDNFRNPYSHAEKKKIFGDDKVSGNHLKLVNGDYVMSDKEEFNIIDLPFFQGIAQAIKAKNDSYDYFKYVDSVIRETLSKLMTKK